MASMMMSCARHNKTWFSQRMHPGCTPTAHALQFRTRQRALLESGSNVHTNKTAHLKIAQARHVERSDEVFVRQDLAV